MKPQLLLYINSSRIMNSHAFSVVPSIINENVLKMYCSIVAQFKNWSKNYELKYFWHLAYWLLLDCSDIISGATMIRQMSFGQVTLGKM